MKSTAQSLTSATSWRRWFVFTVLFITLDNFSALASDTWTGAGSTSNWTNGDNWSTGAPPVMGDTVIMLGPGNTSNTANTGGLFPTWTLNILQFASQAPSFTIHIKGRDAGPGPGMTITGGVINFSANTQFLEVDPGNSFNAGGTPGELDFTQNALVLQVQIDNNGGTALGGGGPKEGGTTMFSGSSSAGQATINNYGAAISATVNASATAGQTIFKDNTLAGSATINNVGGTLQSTHGGATTFQGRSDASSATITNTSATANSAQGGSTFFLNSATGGNATINNNGAGVIGLSTSGVTEFFDSSSGGSATIFNNGGTVASAVGGETGFDTNSSVGAGNAMIVNNGGMADFANGGKTSFIFTSTAGNATITNNGTAIDFANGGETDFRSASTAGSAMITNNGAGSSDAGSGITKFFDTSTAANATINNNGAAVTNALGGETQFIGTSTAGSATINNNGGAGSGAGGGFTAFFNTSTAGNATIVNNPGTSLSFQTPAEGGHTIFSATSDASNATLIANGVSSSKNFAHGGLISFLDNSTDGTARVEVFGNGSMDISGHTAPGVTIGSIEGSGFVSLGANNLTVGKNNLSTNFSGVAQDGGPSGGTGGSLTKIGTGTLTLSGTNTYTGATTVNAGKLLVDGSIASSSNVNVNAGATLGGHGNVSSISGAGAIAPGNSPGILTATHLDPSSGMSFVFELTQTGSPTYSNAAASGNDVLRLTDSTPFTMSLTSSNQITIDFSGASLAAGQLYRGGFFTDTAIATSLVSGATFLYTGTDGFTVNFDGFVTELSAAFASGPVVNGTVLQFDISGEGNGGGPTVPDAAPTLALMLLSLSATFGLNSLLLRRSATEVNHAN